MRTPVRTAARRLALATTLSIPLCAAPAAAQRGGPPNPNQPTGWTTVGSFQAGTPQNLPANAPPNYFGNFAAQGLNGSDRLFQGLKRAVRLIHSHVGGARGFLGPP